MPVFAYRGLDAGGRSVKGVVDADSARTARAKLRASGTYPTELNEESNAAEREVARKEWLPSLWRRKMPAADLAERMQVLRLRLSEEPVPCVGAEPHDA